MSRGGDGTVDTVDMSKKYDDLGVHPTDRVGGAHNPGYFHGIFVGASRPLK